VKLVVFSDVHGNLPALELMLKQVGKVDGYISLGDVVNYGPWSNECVDVLHALPNITSIEGNHETYFIKGKYDGANEVAQSFFDFCYPAFQRKKEIRNRVKEYRFNNFTFAHTIDNQYIYPDSSIRLHGNYAIGHSHHQFTIEQPPYVLYNPGSVGQNRKYINVINYALLDSDTMKFDSRSLIYDEQLIIKEMKVRRYPSLCISYYDNKERLT
jgi:predicted phosphodiesterase